jgi:hypothetical protein
VFVTCYQPTSLYQGSGGYEAGWGHKHGSWVEFMHIVPETGRLSIDDPTASQFSCFFFPNNDWVVMLWK